MSLPWKGFKSWHGTGEIQSNLFMKLLKSKCQEVSTSSDMGRSNMLYCEIILTVYMRRTFKKKTHVFECGVHEKQKLRTCEAALWTVPARWSI